jgi:large subunit ribosomal protein L25
MAELSLEVSRREEAGKGPARRLRQQGKVPAVVYGGHRETVPITVDRKAITDLIQKSEHGVRSIFLLKMSGSDQQRHAMIKDIQIDPLTRKMTHVDFIRIMMDEVIRTTVPVRLIGSPIGAKEGGIVDFQVRSLHVECLPNAIPDKIDVDISNLDMHQYIRISDLTPPQGVKVLDDPDRVVVGVTHAKAEELPVAPEAAAAAEAVPTEPEVIPRGKKPEEETEEKE